MRRPSSSDRDALAVWWGSRLALAVLVLAASWQLSGATAGTVPGFLERWDRWDVGLLRKVAEFGYAGYPEDYPDRGIEAFFPGFPLVLRLVHTVVPDWTAAGLLISLLAGSVAMPALARLAELDGVSGRRAVLALVLSPYAVFLAAGYSEALFLACALPGWLAARSGRWRLASVLLAGTALVRVSGLFLAVGLVVEYLVVRRGRPDRDAPWLVLPFLALLGYAGYLYTLTGDWLAWQHAQTVGWGRELTAPWTALSTTLAAARNPAESAEYVWSFAAEIVAVAVGVGLTVLLLARRRWGEATYVGLSVTALATSTYYLSVARATLLWWPLWVLLAAGAQRWPRLGLGLACVSVPLMAVGALTFTHGLWLG